MKPGWRTFVNGQTYTVDEFIDQTWGPDHARIRALPPETLFRYHKPPGEHHGYFEEIVEPENALISSETAHKAVEELRERGMSYRQIARLGGVSIESVHRSANGVGRIRQSTETALLQVAGSLSNGNGRKC
jgi:hypothetical protein